MMNSLTEAQPHFAQYAPFYISPDSNHVRVHIDREATIYLDGRSLHAAQDNPPDVDEIVVLDRHLQPVKTVDYRAIFNFITREFWRSPVHSFFVTRSGHYVVSTPGNSVFVLDDTGGIVNQRPRQVGAERDPTRLPGDFFAANFFFLRDDRVAVLTYGFPQRGRYILTISRDSNPSFLDELPFPTRYLNDVYSDAVYNLNLDLSPVPDMDMTNAGKDNIRTEYTKFNQLAHQLFHQHPTTDPDWHTKYEQAISSHKLRVPHGGMFFLSAPCIKQVIDLNPAQLLITLFPDRESRSAQVDKGSPYYLLLIDKASGETIRDVSPGDTSMAKNPPFWLGNDERFDRVVLKTYDNLFFIDRTGHLYETISLADRAFSLFRSWSLLGIAQGIWFLYDSRNNRLLAIELGESAETIRQNIRYAIRRAKQQRVRPKA